MFYRVLSSFLQAWDSVLQLICLLSELLQAFLKQGIICVFCGLFPAFMWILPVLHDHHYSKLRSFQLTQ